MPGPCFLRGDRVGLHVVAADDHAFLQRHWNHPEIRPGFGNPGPTSAEDIADRVDSVADAADELQFLVCAGGDSRSNGDDSDPDPVGETFVFDLHEGRGRAEIGYWIAPAHQGNGYASAALDLLLGYLFDERRLHKVDARVLAFNDGSRRVLEKAGFVHEGCRRDAFYVEDEYVDADLYGLLADEWAGPDTATAGGAD